MYTQIHTCIHIYMYVCRYIYKKSDLRVKKVLNIFPLVYQFEPEP